jgi:hypothetical protein
MQLWKLIYHICRRRHNHRLWLKTLAYGDQQDDNPNMVSEYSRSNHKFRIWYIFASIIFAVIIAASTITLHIIQEKNPRAFPYVDSFGEAGVAPYMPGNFTGGNATRWTDCFFVELPSDKLGFLKEWWDEKESTRVGSIIAFM